MSYQEVSWERDGSTVTLTINRPESLNALTAGVRQELLQGLEEADRDAAVRVVVIRGAGRAFSVGQDLKELVDFYESHGYAMGDLVQTGYIPIVKALRGMSKPTVAVLQGAAVGGGMALALAADFRVISDRAQLVPAFVKVGLAPDTGTTFLLARSIGYVRAVAISMTGQALKARDMVDLGLASGVAASPEELESSIEALTEMLAQGPTKAYAAIRRLFDSSVQLPLNAVLDLERDTQDALAHTKDHREAVDAFLAKREPNFRGE